MPRKKRAASSLGGHFMVELPPLGAPELLPLSAAGQQSPPGGLEAEDDSSSHAVMARDRHAGFLASGFWGGGDGGGTLSADVTTASQRGGGAAKPVAAAPTVAASAEGAALSSAACAVLKEAEAMLEEMMAWQSAQMRALHRRLTGAPCRVCRSAHFIKPELYLSSLLPDALVVLHSSAYPYLSLPAVALEQVQDDMIAKTVELASLQRCAARLLHAAIGIALLVVPAPPLTVSLRHLTSPIRMAG